MEFKSTGRWNLRAVQADRTIEHVITKTVCGFLNVDGGSLLIEVDDAGGVVGLSDDLKTLGANGNLDVYELFARQLMDNSLSIQTAGIVRIHFESSEDAEARPVWVAASGGPAFAKPLNGGRDATEFWVLRRRAGSQ